MQVVRRTASEVGLPAELIPGAVLLVRRAEALGFGTGSDVDLRTRLDGVLAAIDAGQVVAVDINSIRRGLNEPVSDQAELSRQLHRLFEALGESRAPQQEAQELLRVFGAEQLAELLVVSPTSVRRYARGQRRPPRVIADRLHWLALLVGCLNGTYNDFGVCRWFERPRAALDGSTPKQALLASPDWTPNSDGARELELLAQALIGMAVT